MNSNRLTQELTSLRNEGLTVCLYMKLPKGLAANQSADRQSTECQFQSVTLPPPLVSAELCSAWEWMATQRKPPFGVFHHKQNQSPCKQNISGCPLNRSTNTPPQNLVALRVMRS